MQKSKEYTKDQELKDWGYIRFKFEEIKHSYKDYKTYKIGINKMATEWGQ